MLRIGEQNQTVLSPRQDELIIRNQCILPLVDMSTAMRMRTDLIKFFISVTRLKNNYLKKTGNVFIQILYNNTNKLYLFSYFHTYSAAQIALHENFITKM